jgi:hypothetical protein
MKIFAVTEAYESPCAYFATREDAEAFVSDANRYHEAMNAWDGESDFVYPEGLDPREWYPHDAFIETIDVR